MARCYERFRAVFPLCLILNAENRQLQSLIESIELSDKTVIDLGTGTGNALQFCEHALLSIGIDANRTMLDFARRKRSKSDFIQADVRFLPLKDGSVDLVVAVGISEYLSDLNPLFKEMVRILSKSGYCIFTFSPTGIMTNLRALFGHKIYPRNLDEIEKLALFWQLKSIKRGNTWMQRQILFQKIAPA
ncbi:MAG: class I SAM-dependent methyltransferase [candidate division KSB1 bacterium]|nr:class I SAM-dependent methyltransferase [candidate division KSB1 bacterium]MDZ7357907.1 class I SAM-dependent methyltransferase [candidate division KSB1 bacterium]MDZ7401625.1 class I SAM-dependent methyltransferase [candidate division KSB1 bacterium]